jgi:hypothetical protein
MTVRSDGAPCRRPHSADRRSSLIHTSFFPVRAYGRSSLSQRKKCDQVVGPLRRLIDRHGGNYADQTLS